MDNAKRKYLFILSIRPSQINRATAMFRRRNINIIKSSYNKVVGDDGLYDIEMRFFVRISEKEAYIFKHRQSIKDIYRCLELDFYDFDIPIYN